MTQALAQAVQSRKTFSYYVTSLIGIGITFGFGYLPPVEPLTTVGMQVVGVFIGMIFLWSFVGLLWPSLLGMLALGLTDAITMPKVFSVAFGSPIMVLFGLSMVLFGAFQHYGVSRYISYWLLTRKIINGKPIVFTFVFIYTTYVLAVLGSILPSILLMWPILYNTLKDVGYKKGDAYTSIMVGGVLFGATLGQAAKPFVGTPLIVLASYEKASGVPMDYLPYMLYGFIMSTLGIIAYTLVVKYVLRPDMSKIASINITQFTKNPLPPMDKRQRILLACLFSYFIIILLPSIAPNDLAVIGILKKLTAAGITLVFLTALHFYKIAGEPCVDVKMMASRYINWNVFCLGGMAVAIAGVLATPETGLTAFLSQIFSPILEGMPAYLSIFLVMMFGMAITQVANNAVMASVLMPVIGVFCAQTGMSFSGAATLMTFAMHVAVLSPAASPYAAMLYSNTEWIDGRDAVKYATVFFLTCVVVYALVGIPLMEVIH